MLWFITSLDNPLVLLTILIVILILFGAKRIPEMMHGLGKGLSEFKRGAREATDEVQRAITADTPPAEAKPVEPAQAAEPPAEDKPTQG